MLYRVKNNDKYKPGVMLMIACPTYFTGSITMTSPNSMVKVRLAKLYVCNQRLGKMTCNMRKYVKKWMDILGKKCFGALSDMSFFD